MLVTPTTTATLSDNGLVWTVTVVGHAPILIAMRDRADWIPEDRAIRTAERMVAA